MEKGKYFSMDWKEGGTKMELWCNYTRCYLLCLDFSTEAKKIDLFLEGADCGGMCHFGSLRVDSSSSSIVSTLVCQVQVVETSFDAIAKGVSFVKIMKENVKEVREIFLI